MLHRFTGETRAIVVDALEIARDRNAPTVEAEHLLLAVTRTRSAAAQVLGEHGLDTEGLSAALASETARSLAAVGVSADPVSFSPYVTAPRLATSAKLALERALRAAVADVAATRTRSQPITAKHLVLGALRAPTGTVPRALECAGVDRVALISALSA